MDGSLFAPSELKFDEARAGSFSGSASVFNHQDQHEDVVLKGAFLDTMVKHKARGTMPGMFVEHSKFTGGDPLPIGVWKSIEEDDVGLKVTGQLAALDTSHGKRIYSLMKEGALPGLSIAFNVPPGGSVRGKSGEPKRTLKAIDLVAIDVVRSPSNALARVEGLRAIMGTPNIGSATSSLVAAMMLHKEGMSGPGGPTGAQRAMMMQHMQDAHESLTGHRTPAGMKSMPATIREFETWLRDEFGVSNSVARSIAEGGFKSAETARDELVEETATKSALGEIAEMLQGFSLKS